MKVCVPCKNEMLCLKNGVALKWGKTHAYNSDTYRCPSCGNVVAFGNMKPYQDEYTDEHTIQMEENHET